MLIRTIMIPVRGDGKGERVMDHALAMAKKFGAHLDVFHARPRPEDLATFGAPTRGFMKGEMLDAANEMALLEEQRVKNLFEEYCVEHKLTIIEKPPAPGNAVSASWHEETGTQADVLGLRGRLTDLIFVAQPEKRLGVKTFEAALFETGKPVIVAPQKEVSSIGETIAIAWNGSPESARAVTSALAILEKAAKVVVFASEAGPDKRLDASALDTYLRWHGVEAELKEFDSDAHRVGQNLLRRAAEIDADLLVMGGFGQIHRRELMMGGVTQYIVERSEIPVLLHH